jgi:hypothetical protein
MRIKYLCISFKGVDHKSVNINNNGKELKGLKIKISGGVH